MKFLNLAEHVPEESTNGLNGDSSGFVPGVRLVQDLFVVTLGFARRRIVGMEGFSHPLEHDVGLRANGVVDGFFFAQLVELMHGKTTVAAKERRGFRKLLVKVFQNRSNKVRRPICSQIRRYTK